MKNYGWDEAINRVNARIENGITVDLKTDAPQPPEPESDSDKAVLKARKRHVAIAKACAEAGVTEHAIAYFSDLRELSEILDEIRSVHLVTDFAAHQGLAAEFKPRAN